MELTRKELYDLVWSEPMTTICKRFGLSDNGLRKRCKSMNIPTPPLGYWAKLKYGKQVTPLPFQQEETNATQSTTLQEAKEPKVEMEKIQKMHSIIKRIVALHLQRVHLI